MIQLEQAPSDMPQKWREYFDRVFRRVGIEMAKDLVINETDRVPSKVADGTLVRFKGAIPGSQITGKGLWFHDKGTWTKVA